MATSDEFGDLLNDFGRRPGIAKRALYLVLALFATAAPALLFTNIFLVDLAESQVTVFAGIAIAAVVLSLSYHNLCFARSARLRVSAIAPTKGQFKGRLPEFAKATAAHEARIANAALLYSFAYNNLLYLSVAPLAGCYVFADKFGGDLNLLLSGATAAGLCLFNSVSALKAIGE